tara:strand:+ start:14694 stop:15419 length:726 start_codon:yes stop_codon:yes gene_type:complete
MIPIFTTHYSIGKSILTLDEPSDSKEGSSSVFALAEKANLDQVVLVENSMTGFPEAFSTSKKLGVQLIFGLKIRVDKQGHKCIVFAKNSDGCQNLNEIYSASNASAENITVQKLKDIWSDSLIMAIPFYDSFLYKNTMSFDTCTPNLKFFNPVFFLEQNDLPFDQLIRSKVLDYCASNNFRTEECKSIKYESRQDVEAFQTYQCICNRKFGQKSLSNPGLDHFGSNEFSFESFLEHEAQPF